MALRKKFRPRLSSTPVTLDRSKVNRKKPTKAMLAAATAGYNDRWDNRPDNTAAYSDAAEAECYSAGWRDAEGDICWGSARRAY